MLVVGLSGVARSGKDEAAEALVRQLGFVKRSLSLPLHEGLVAMNPIVACAWDGEVIRYADIAEVHGYEAAKDLYPECRRLLQAYGTEGGRSIHGENCWVDLCFQWAEDNGVKRLVIPNIRFANEADAVTDRQGVVYRISRPGVGPVNNHVSDTGLTDEDFDPSMVLVNNKEVQDLHRLLVRRVSADFGL